MNRPPASPQPLSPERVLEIVGDKLAEIGGQWSVESGPLLRGPSSLGVRLSASPHTDDHRHLDLEFLVGIGTPNETAIADCTSGLSPDPEEAVRQGVAQWIDTTASAVLELAEHRGRLAAHFQPGNPGEFRGWHAIGGSAVAWGIGPDVTGKAQWMSDTMPWTGLAPLLADDLDREYLNGIRLFIGQSSTFQSIEVKVNGRLHEKASAALAAMDWPRTEKMTTAKTFLLLAHRTPADGSRDDC